MVRQTKKVDLSYYWRLWTLAFMALAWIVIVFFMRQSLLWLLPVYIAYFAINAIIFRSYFLGMVGNYFFFTGKDKKAYQYYEKAIKLNTRNVTALCNYGLRLLRESKPKEALDIFERALLINTKAVKEKDLLLAISSCHWGMGNIDKGIETLLSLKSKYEYVNPHAYTTLGYFYFLKEDYDTARMYTQKALDDDETYGSAWDNLGQIDLKEGKINDAKAHFEKALEFRPSLVDSLFFLGTIYENENNIEKAKFYYEKASKANISALNTVKVEEVTEKYNKYCKE